MATASKLTRVFMMDTVRLNDPDPSMSVEQVKDLYTASFPHLQAATCSEGEVKGGEIQYRFVQPVVKTKG